MRGEVVVCSVMGMMREDAVALFEAEGFRAWIESHPAMGEMVVVGMPRVDGGDAGGEGRAKVVQVFPIKEEWGIAMPGVLLTVDWKRRYSMERACEVAMALLRCELLPIADGDLLICRGRAVGGGSFQYVEHEPTGIRREMKRPGGPILLREEEARDEIVFELALREDA